MDSSLGTGCMAVFAVSGSVVFLAMQVNKRLLSKFMDDMEFEIRNSSGRVKEEPKKKVRFAGEVVETPANGKAFGKKYKERLTATTRRYNENENLESMPQNWQAMYRGRLQYRNMQREYN